jgi:hypothetical protein
MANVVDIGSRRPHYAGPCSCLKCKYEWTGVVPVDHDWLECPSCRALQGVWFSAREVRLAQALEQIATGTSGRASDDVVIMRDVAKAALAAEKYGC